jgi:hypothetical protein
MVNEYEEFTIILGNWRIPSFEVSVKSKDVKLISHQASLSIHPHSFLFQNKLVRSNSITSWQFIAAPWLDSSDVRMTQPER